MLNHEWWPSILGESSFWKRQIISWVTASANDAFETWRFDDYASIPESGRNSMCCNSSSAIKRNKQKAQIQVKMLLLSYAMGHCFQTSQVGGTTSNLEVFAVHQANVWVGHRPGHIGGRWAKCGPFVCIKLYQWYKLCHIESYRILCNFSNVSTTLLSMKWLPNHIWYWYAEIWLAVQLQPGNATPLPSAFHNFTGPESLRSVEKESGQWRMDCQGGSIWINDQCFCCVAGG